jgi:hypothetical protein
MAIDSVAKRFRILNGLNPDGPFTVVPDGTIDASDRIGIIGLYLAGEEAAEPPAGGDDRTYVIGMGAMGKTRVHPHPLFSRVKQ